MYGFVARAKRIMQGVLAGLCTLLLSVMTLLVLWQVFTRYALNDPSSFTEELVRDFLIWTSFAGAAYAFSSREHMALIFLRDRLDPRKRKAVMVFGDSLVLLFALFVMVIGGVKLALSARMEYSALLGIPRSLVYSMAPLSGIFIIFAQAINIYEDVTGRAVAQEEEK